MQSPTCTRMRVRDVRDAEIILHAVALRRLPMVLRRLDDEERMALTSGCVYVWEERSSSPLEASGQEIQRFTEGRSWGPSRARDVSSFLFHLLSVFSHLLSVRAVPYGARCSSCIASSSRSLLALI